MTGKYVAPKITGPGIERFTCPSPDCQTLTSHTVLRFEYQDEYDDDRNRVVVDINGQYGVLYVSICSECDHEIVWMLYSNIKGIELPVKALAISMAFMRWLKSAIRKLLVVSTLSRYLK